MGRTATLKKSAGKAKSPAKAAKGPSTAGAKAPARTRRSSIRTYQSALAFLSAQVNHERSRAFAKSTKTFGIQRISRLLGDLGNPHKSLRTVHIAGSKGKGSTAAMLANMLQGNGLRVGLYTSPHVMDIRERICINNQMIPRADFTKLVSRVAAIVAEYKSGHPTYFDILTAVAFRYFADRQVGVAIIETGIGGRLDSTNVIQPEVCGITSISLDHVPRLGRTLPDIAAEKAGVFKNEVPVISAAQPPEVKATLKAKAAEANAPLSFVGSEIAFNYRFEASHAGRPKARIGVATATHHYDHVTVPMMGEHQAMNCAVAVGILDALKNRGFEIDDETAIAGLANARLPGRMELLCSDPRVIADGAHNSASIKALMRAIGQNVAYDSMVVIFGCCADKDLTGMLRHVLLGADKVIFTRVDSPRAADPADLAQIFSEITNGRMAQVEPTLAGAMETAEKAVSRDDLICITGSFYLVGQAKRFFADHPHRVESTPALAEVETA